MTSFKILSLALILWGTSVSAALYDLDEDTSKFGRAMFRDTHKYRQAQLDAAKRENQADRAVERERLAFEKKKYSDAQRQKVRAESFEREKEEDRRRERRQQRARAEAREENLRRNEEALEFLRAWHKEGKTNPQRVDVFTQEAIKQAQSAKRSGRTLSEETIREVLKRKLIILKALRSREQDIRDGKVEKEKTRSNIRKAISKGVTGYTYADANKHIEIDKRRVVELEEEGRHGYFIVSSDEEDSSSSSEEA